MMVEITGISFLYLLGAIQGLFIASYLFFNQKINQTSSTFLTLILVGLCLTLYDYFILQNSFFKEVAPFYLVSYPFQLAYAPLTYFLVKGIVFPAQKISWKALWHFIPAFIHLVYGLILFHFQSQAFQLQYLEQLILQSSPQDNIQYSTYQYFHLFIALQLLIYLVFTFRQTSQYVPSPNFQAPLNEKKVKQLFWTLFALNVILLGFSLNLRSWIFQWFGQDVGYWILILLSIYLFYLGYFILFNTEIFHQPILKYQSSKLANIQKANLLANLEQIMETEKPYYQADLNIKQLAEMVNMPIRQLSQLINEAYTYNFYEYINSYRIKEAQKLLLSDQGKQLSILGIAYEVGFHSKSSFYTAFKKFTGMTPGAYQKQKKNQ